MNADEPFPTMAATANQYVVNALSAIVYIYDLETQSNVFANTGLERLLGYSPPEVQALGAELFARLVHPDDLPGVIAFQSKITAAADQDILELEYRMKHRSGAWRRLHSYEQPYRRNADGSLKQKIGIAVDVTEHKRLELLLATESHVLGIIAAGAALPEVLRAIVEGIEALSPDTLGSILLLDPDGLRVRHGAAPRLPEAFNRALDGALIGPREGSCGTAAYRREPVVVTDIETDPLWDNYRALARAHHLRACWSTPILTAGGAVLGTFAMYYREPRGPQPDDFMLIERATHLAGVAIERSRAEAGLREREQLLTSLYETVGDVIFRLNVEADGAYRFVSVNQAFVTTTGLSREMIVGKRVDEVIPEPSLSLVLGRYQQAIATGQAVRWEETSTYPTGTLVGEVSVAPGFDDTGQCTHLVGAVHDITERKRAEEALRESEQRFQNAFEHAAIGMALVAPDGRWLRVNESLCDLVGYSKEELLTKTFQDITHPDDLDADLELTRQLLAGEIRAYRMEKRYFHKSGRVVWVLLALSLVRDRQDAPLYFVSQIEDITERKHAELEKERTQYLLRERVKELSTLHRVAQILQSEQTSIPEVLREVVSVLPAAWQFPEIAAARITLPGAEYATPGFALSPWRQSAAFRLRDGQAGAVEVAYLEERPPEIEGPFYAEERNLLNTLAEMLHAYLERKQAEQNVQHQLAHITALHTIDSSILSSLELRETLNIVLEQVTSQLNTDAANILLLNPHLHRLDNAARRGFRAATLERTPGRLGKGYAGQAALERRIVHIPDIVEAGDGTPREQHMQAEAFATYFGAPLIAKGQVKGVLEVFHRAAFHPDHDWLAFLDVLAGQAAIAIDNLEMFQGLQRSNLELALAYDVTLEGWSKALDLRDKETEGHTARVTEMTVRLARAMGLSDGELARIRQGALLHDVGKLGIPDSILLKPEPLTEAEWVVMRRHPRYAYEWLSPIDYLRPALDIPYCHHEKWDGSGYPRGLQGEAIPLAARLFAVVDVYDALTSDRPYREAWSKEKTLEYIAEKSGKEFDPQVVEVFRRVVHQAELVSPASP